MRHNKHLPASPRTLQTIILVASSCLLPLLLAFTELHCPVGQSVAAAFSTSHHTAQDPHGAEERSWGVIIRRTLCRYARALCGCLLAGYQVSNLCMVLQCLHVCHFGVRITWGILILREADKGLGIMCGNGNRCWAPCIVRCCECLQRLNHCLSCWPF